MDSSEWFDLVRKSGLIDSKTISTWCNRFSQDSDGRTIAESMVREQLLTSWQADKLLLRKWKGFFVDQFCITGLINSDENREVLVLEALDTNNRTTVILEVVTSSWRRTKDGKLLYSVRPSFN